MKVWLVVVLCCSLVPATNAAPPAEIMGREYAETLLLLSQSDFDVRLAAKSLYRAGSERQSMLDLLAEVTWMACAGKRKLHLDAFAWSVKTLGSSEQARYAGLLDFCLANMSDEKSQKYLRQARANLQGTAASLFHGGTLDVAQVRERLQKRSRPRAAGQAESRFDGVHKGQSLNEIYATFGQPDAVSGVNIPGRAIGHGPVQVRTSRDMIVFDYGGLGAVRFAYDEAGADWLVAEATSDKGLYWSNGGGRFGSFDDFVATGDDGDLREVVKLLRKRDRIERSTLDRVADRIYQLRVDPDDDLADTLAWLCRILGDSGDGRYKQMLAEVADSGGDKTLRRHAGKAADRLPKTTEPAYVPTLARK